MRSLLILIVFLCLYGTVASRNEQVLANFGGNFPAGTIELGQLNSGGHLVITMTCFNLSGPLALAIWFSSMAPLSSMVRLFRKASRSIPILPVWSIICKIQECTGCTPFSRITITDVPSKPKLTTML